MDKLFFEEVPADVREVLLMTSCRKYFGSEDYIKIQEVIKKYPKYFPWETKYNSIPEEVHNKYREEGTKLYYEFFPPSGNGIKDGEGIIAFMNRVHEENINKPKKSLSEVFEDLKLQSITQKKYQKAKEKLWEQHYKPYKLKYRNE